MTLHTAKRKSLNQSLHLRIPTCRTAFLLGLFFIIQSGNSILGQTCPSGSATASTGYAVTATGGSANPSNATGAFLASGSTLTTGNSATLSTTVYLVADLQKWVSQGSTLTVSWQRISGTPTASVEISNDNVTFTSLGALTGTSSTPATSAYVGFTVPAGGLRYVRILQTAGSAYVDGVRYTHTCYYPVNAINDTRVFINPGKAKGNIANNDLNYDNDSAIYSLAAINVTNGTLTFTNAGAYTYTPNANFDGVDYFSYRVCDAGPDKKYYTTGDNTCDTAVVTFRSLFNCDSTKFYIPIPENEAMDFLEDVQASNSDPMQFYAGLSVSSDALVLYDHWEDGYESDITAPTQSSTQIWGDGDLTNGVAPGFPTDVLDAGKAIILSNAVTSGHTGSTSYDPNAAASDATLQGTVDYDGKDKIFVGGIGSLAKFAWGSAGTVSISGAAVPAVSKWDTLYTLPIGANTTGGGVSVEIASLSIMASQNNTIIRIDRDANGSVDIRDTLDQGETRYVDSRFNGSTIAVNQGGTIRSNKPIMVQLMTGDFQTASPGYEGRTYSLIPNSQFSTCYYMPAVPSENMRVFLYNPTGSNITVTRTTAGGATSTITVNANSSNFQDVNLSGLGYKYCSTTGFAMITSVDHNSATSDWGFTPVPTTNLSTKVLMSVGAGCDPFNALYGTENDEVALITVDSATYLYADVNGDGTPDKVSFNADVDVTDASVTIGGVTYNETTSNAGIAMSAYQTIAIGSSTGNLNGATFWTKTAANNTGNAGKNIVLVWGQNGGPAAAPNIDAGYTVPNIQLDITNVVIKSADSICVGSNTDSIKVTYKGGTSPYKVLWYNETTNTFAKFNTTKDSFTILNIEPGSYLIKIKDANCRNLSIRTNITTRTSGCNFTISGTLYHDPNGLTNSLIDGTAKGVFSGSNPYAYLVNLLGNIVDSSKINPNGTYSLTGPRSSNNTVRLSTTVAGIGAAAPAVVLPAHWSNTGEQYGSSNGAGTGIEAGSANGIISVGIGTSNITNVNFGLERTTIGHDKTYLISPDSVLNRKTMDTKFSRYIRLYNTSGNADTTVNSSTTTTMPGRVSGSDLEDGRMRGGSGSFGKLALTQLPDTATDGVLLYKGIYLYPNPGVSSPSYIYWNATTGRYEIPSFKPDSLVLYVKVAFQSSSSFKYAYVDNAGKAGIQSTYRINYLIPLPMDIIFTGRLSGRTARLEWKTFNAHDIANYELYRAPAGNANASLIARVNETGLLNYEYNDDLSEQPSGTYLYYLHSVSHSGIRKPEGIAAISLNTDVPRSVLLSPNPAGKFTCLNLLGYDNAQEGLVELYSQTGAKIESIAFTGNTVTFNTEHLSSGIYTLKLLVEGEVTVLLLSVNN